MKLKALESEIPPCELSLQIPGKLFQQLEDYRRYFQAKHGQEIDVETLVVQMVDAFIASDREFKKWRRARLGLTTRTRKRATLRIPANLNGHSGPT